MSLGCDNISIGRSEKGGPFTRKDPSNPNIKSCLSLVIVSTGLEEYVEELKIDCDRTFTPHSATSKNLVYSDHYSLIFKLKEIPMKVKSFRKENTPVIWNTHKEGGRNKYYVLTTNSPELDAIAEETKELMTRFSRKLF